MIQAVFQSDQQGMFGTLIVEGHAGLEKQGSDILCAAVSVLAENLEAGLRYLLKLDVEAQKESGYHTIKINCKSIGTESQLLFASALLGMQILEQDYPSHLQVKEIKQD